MCLELERALASSQQYLSNGLRRLEELQRHSLLTARLAKRIMPEPKLGADVFTAGVIHDVGNLVNPLSLDILHPGVAVYGSYDGDASPLLFRDSPGSVLTIRRDAAAYAADHGQGALIIHFQNKRGYKAQVVYLKSAGK